MHHLLLLLPLFGLVLFIFLLWQVALPLYVIIPIGSPGIYWKILKAQCERLVIGKRAMIGERVRVINVRGSEIEVEYGGEIWCAISLASATWSTGDHRGRRRAHFKSDLCCPTSLICILATINFVMKLISLRETASAILVRNGERNH